MALVEERPLPGKRRVPGRPRSEACRSAILEAAADLLEELPYAKVSIESVAARAGVSKQTIYKWWKSRALLAMQAYAGRQGRLIPSPDTGNVRSDLLTVLRATCRLLRTERYGQVVAGMIAEMQSDPDLASEFRETYIASRRAMVTGILERGIARGEVRSKLDLPFVIDLMYGPVWYRLLLRHAPLDDKFAVQVVDHLVMAIRS